jgi:anti-sigma-K factor RskA
MKEGSDMHEVNREPVPTMDRLRELLADRALFGLDAAEERELAGLLRDHPAEDADALDRIAAAAALATAATAQLPEELRARLHDDVRRLRSPPVTARAGRWIVVAGGIGLATAASLLAVIGRRDAPVVPAPAREADAPAVAAKVAPTPAVQRAELLATVADAVQLDCAAAGAADERQAEGDVVWSPSRQRGFLRIRGLTPNDPGRSQYQVWIMDGDRGTPVPGGVFDVAGAAGDVVVPILPRAFVQGPTMFAVTVEPPGGAADAGFERERVVARAE